MDQYSLIFCNINLILYLFIRVKYISCRVNIIQCMLIFTYERSERSSYQQLYMDRLDDIQTAVKSEKFKIHFYDHFRTKKFKTMNQPAELTRP